VSSQARTLPPAGRTHGSALAAAAVYAPLLRSLPPPAADDYPFDAVTALCSLAHGHVADFFSHQPIMGPFALYLRAPFVLVASTVRSVMASLSASDALLNRLVMAMWRAVSFGRP